MSSFTKPLKIEITTDGCHGTLIEDFSYYTNDGETFTVPAGYTTDFATSPWWAWSIFPKIGTYTKAAVFHDWCYDNAIKTKKWADKEFFTAMIVLETPRWKAYLMYLGVKFFGKGTYSVSLF